MLMSQIRLVSASAISSVLCSQPAAKPLINFRLPNPSAERLVCAANLARDRTYCAPLRSMLVLVLQHHPYCSFTILR